MLEKATSNIEFPEKKFLSLKEKNLHDNQKQQNDGEPAHILISIGGKCSVLLWKLHPNL